MAPEEEKSKAASKGHAKEHIDGEHNEWKFKPPYAIHEDNEKSNAIYNGSCHCGRVTYQLSREAPLDSKFCHCGTCQKLHGACFQWACIFHKTDINFTNGHHDLFWYDSQEKTTKHKLPCKVACSYCHTPIMDEGRRMILLFPSLIDFSKDPGAKEKFKPKCHMFYEQRLVDIPDGRPKWRGMEWESELIGDTPDSFRVEAKKKMEERERERERKRKSEEKDEGANKKQKE